MTTCIECGTRITKGSRCRAHRLRNGSTTRWRNLRTLILGRDGHRCTWTTDGERCQATTNLHVDHIHPVALAGTDHPSNLTTLCRGHNLTKGTSTRHQIRTGCSDLASTGRRPRK